MSVLVTLVSMVLAALSLTATPTATAAGSGMLNLELTPINLTNGSTITDASNGTNNNQITYRVQFSCTTAACDNTKVQMSPAPPDPHGVLPAGEWILEYSTWVPPVGGGTIGGSDITGKLVNLGNLPAGTSGTFTVTYGYQATRGAEVPNGSFYPEGFPIRMSAEATSDTAVAPVTANASDVTWHIGTPTGPTAALAPNNGSFNPDVPVTYRVAVNAGNIVAPGFCLSGNASVVAPGNYRIVYTLPPEAVIQSATDGGVVDNVNHTVTWSKGSLASPSYGARGGFGLAQFSGFNCGGAAANNSLVGDDDDAFWRPRDVTVVFPGTSFPDADPNGCNFSSTVTSKLDVTLNYLDTARTQRSLSQNMNAKVACASPFGGMTVDKRLSGGISFQFRHGDGNLGGTPETYALNATPTGETDPGNRAWTVEVSNLGNVDATAVIDEPNLVQDHLKVFQLAATAYPGAPAAWRATVDWVDNTGATGTASLAHGQSVNAAAGRWFVSAHTTMPVAAGRILPGDQTSATAEMAYRFRVDESAPIGTEITNTAQVRLDYPADADGDGTPDDYTTVTGQPLPSRAISAAAARTVRYTQPAPSLVAQFTGNPVVAGGGNPKVGTEVTYSMRARTDNVWPGTKLRPQLAFLAPAGWEIVPGSAQFTGNGQGETTTAPAGVTFQYLTKTIDGVSRQVVVATWPGVVTPSTTVNENWPTLSVKATPTSTAVVGTNVAAQVWAGDASGAWSTAVNLGYITKPTDFRADSAAVADTPDVDGDGNPTESYASSNSAGVIVAATDGIRVVKELCVPDAGAADGCKWVSSPSQLAGVPVDAANVKYRITLTNSGNTTLHNVVAYDVLPYPGDTGLLASPPPRGSEFSMNFASIESVSPGVTLAYSASTNPARPEVNPGATGTVDDWGPDVAGKKAIRIKLDADLPANTSKQVVFLASVAPGAQADQVACNTAAVDSNETLPVEPLAVCVKLAEADLAVTTGSLSPWRVDKATTIPFTVVNHGGSGGAGATVSIDIPDGIRVDDLTPAGWRCTAPGGAPAPVVGGVTLTCVPVDGAGDVRTLDVDVPEQLVLDVTPTVDSATPVCAGAAITGPMYDRVPENNQDDACQAIAPISTALTLDKSSVFDDDANGDGLADVGDVLTYTFRVENTGNVDVDDVTIDDPKVGAVTPASADIPAGGSQDFTASYTVTQADVDAGGTHNTATASGTPTSGGTVQSNRDTDEVAGPRPVAEVSIVKSAELTTDTGVVGKADVDDVIRYTFVVHNAGPATAHDVSVSDPMTGLSAVSPASVTMLAPGDDAQFTATYTVTQNDVDRGVITNQAAAEFTHPTPPGGPAPGPETVDSNEVEVDTVAADPELSIDKSSVFTTDANGNGLADKGDELTYTFHVENTGNVTLTGVTVNDALPGLSSIAPASADLAPGATQDFTASYTVRQSDVDAGGTFNKATATGDPQTGPPVTSDPDTDEVGSPAADPALSIDKSSAFAMDPNGNRLADKGDVLTYTFHVENTGNVTLTGVTVNDALPGLSSITPAWADLAPGETQHFTASYTVRQSDVDAGGTHNTATASGTPPTGPAVTSDPDTAEVDSPGPAVGQMSIVKSAKLTTDHGEAGKADAGDVITYTFVVRNAGPVTALHVSVSDSLKGLSAVAPASVPTLAPGDDATFTATYQVTAADVAAGSVVNQAAATYTPPTPRGVGTHLSPVTMPSNTVKTLTAAAAPPRFNLKLDKRVVSPKDVIVGDEVRYRLQVSNRGPDAAQGRVVLKDPLPAGLKLLSGQGEGWDCSVKKATDTVACVRDQHLARGEKTAPVFVVAKTTAAAIGRVVNVAEVRAAGDTVRSDNREVARLDVEDVPRLPDTGFRIRVPLV